MPWTLHVVDAADDDETGVCLVEATVFPQDVAPVMGEAMIALVLADHMLRHAADQ